MVLKGDIFENVNISNPRNKFCCLPPLYIEGSGLHLFMRSPRNRKKQWFVLSKTPRNRKHNSFRHMPCKVIPDPISQVAWFQNALAPKASHRGTPDRRRGTSDLLLSAGPLVWCGRVVGRVRQSIEFIHLLKKINGFFNNCVERDMRC